MQVGGAFHQPAVTVGNDFWRFIRIREFTGNGFQHVQRRYQTLYHTKFVGDDNKAPASTTQHAQQVNRIQRLRHHDGRRRGRYGLDVDALFQRHEHLFRAHHTDDLIQLAPTDREQAVRRGEQLLANFVDAQVGVHPADFTARRHNAAQGAGGQRKHAVDHVAFFFHKRAFRHRNRVTVLVIRLHVHLTTPAHQAQDRIGGTRAQRLIRLLLNEVTARNLVKQLDQNREANRGVQVAFRYMETKTFCHQAQTNHQQETQTQHNDRRMLVDETRQRFRRQQHYRHRNHNRRHHHRQMVHHANRCNHRIQ
ncbi:Uncharacterised protein [Enterobacter hormaechei]|nr:Uncharacterised protein [Enterobacter hormaechei]